MVNILIVSAKGDIRTNKAATFTAEGLAKALRKAKAPSQIGSWIVEDGAVELTLWGWRESYAATVKSATFVFPAPHTKLTLFGDAIITATRDGKAADMTEDMWIAACAEIEEMEGPVAAGASAASAAAGDDASEAGSDSDVDADDDEFDDGGDDIDGDEEVADDEEEEEEDADEEDAEDDGEDGDEEEEEDGEDDCYDSDDGGGGGKRRAPRRRAMAAPEFRRMDMGLRARIKMPAPAGKRAPKWQTAPELEPE
jgi:hypothetical protein